MADSLRRPLRPHRSVGVAVETVTLCLLVTLSRALDRDDPPGRDLTA